MTMVQKTEEISNMISILPEGEQHLAYEFIKRLVLAWDPDYTKLTTNERNALEEAKSDLERGETVGFDDIDWD